ncbi:MAG: flagellar basal body rod protein FlgB [bacterium]
MGLISRLFDVPSTVMLKKGIEGTDARHLAISNNIANVDTPNYERATVSFERELQRARFGTGFVGKTTSNRHFHIGGVGVLGEVQPRVVIDNNTRFRADRNNINIDEEMSNLAENTQKNLAFTELLARRYQGIRQVIQTGGQV